MRKWYPWILVGIAAGASVALYGRLPEQLPTHWDAHGDINGWSPRPFGAFLLPGIMAVMALVMPMLPNIDPRRENYEKFRPTYDLVINGVITMLALIHLAVLGSVMGLPIPMARLAPVLAGGLFILLGNVLPRARPNWLFGIRTPWTLSNDRVWERTHRVGGVVFVVAGLVMVIAAAVPPRFTFPVFISVCVAASVVPLVYSFFAWKQETAK